MRKPRILIIENSVAVTGALKSIIRSSEGLFNNYEFIFLLPKNSKATAHVRDLGFEVCELPMKELRKKFFSLIFYVPILFYNSLKLFRVIRKLKIDLITVNDFYNLLPTVYRILGGKLSYICYVRFLPSKFPARLVKFWCTLHRQYAHTTIAVSEAVKKELPFQDNVMIISNELPHEEVHFTSPANLNTLLYPANYIQGKGHEFALESFALISKKHPNWKLKFVGGDMGLEKNKNFRQGLEERAKQLGLNPQVEWRGFSEKISDEYAKAGIVLNFSESESFSLTCLEAMFYGRPLVATRCGGPVEIIDQNETGILVDVKDITAMASAMDYLISNADKRETMAKRAFNGVRQKFSSADTIGKLDAVYKSALKDYSS